MTERIIVINPNSSETVTRAIDAAVEPLRRAGGPEIECLTLAEGPPGIETQRHVDEVVAPLCRLALSPGGIPRGVSRIETQRSWCPRGDSNTRHAV